MVFDQNAMIANVLKAITRRVPVCTICNGDTAYVQTVADAMLLVPSTLWPSLETVFEDNFSAQRRQYRKLLSELLGQYTKPKANP